MPFSGFTEDDFEIFSLPDFDTRMPALKGRLTPKLKSLGETLLPQLIEATGLELFCHTALHMRRSVHPAEETWTCFSRSNRAYKPFVHFRVAINGSGMKIAMFMEEYADDKPTLAAGMKKNAAALAAYLKDHPEIRSHDHEANYGKLMEGRTLKKAEIVELAERLSKVKSQHANFSIRMSRAEAVASPEEFVRSVVVAVRALAPIYRLGAEPGFKMG